MLVGCIGHVASTGCEKQQKLTFQTSTNDNTKEHCAWHGCACRCLHVQIGVIQALELKHATGKIVRVNIGTMCKRFFLVSVGGLDRSNGVYMGNYQEIA